MIICICHRVSDRAIAHAAQSGCASFDELQFELSVAMGCGKCHDCARETFEFHAAAHASNDSSACPAAVACNDPTGPATTVRFIAASHRVEAVGVAAA